MAYIYRTSYLADFTRNSQVKELHFYQEKIQEPKKKSGLMRSDPSSIKGMIEKSEPFDFEGYQLEECWATATNEFTELLEQLPEVIDNEIIKRRLQNTYKYAEKKEVNPNDCFQYLKRVPSSQSDSSNTERVLIQIRTPFAKSYIPVTIVAQGAILLGVNHFFVTNQSRVDAIYNRSEQELILQDSNRLECVSEKDQYNCRYYIDQYNCHHYLPESMGHVKKLEFN